MEIVSFNLAKMLTSKRLSMVEDGDFTEKFLSYVDTWERAKNIEINKEQIVKAINCVYTEKALDEISQDGTKYDKDKKEVLLVFFLKTL